MTGLAAFASTFRRNRQGCTRCIRSCAADRWPASAACLRRQRAIRRRDRRRSTADRRRARRRTRRWARACAQPDRAASLAPPTSICRFLARTVRHTVPARVACARDLASDLALGLEPAFGPRAISYHAHDGDRQPVIQRTAVKDRRTRLAVLSGPRRLCWGLYGPRVVFLVPTQTSPGRLAASPGHRASRLTLLSARSVR